MDIDGTTVCGRVQDWATELKKMEMHEFCGQTNSD